MKIKFYPLFTLLITVISSTLWMSCSDTTPILTFGESKIRIINAAPDAGNIKLYANDSLKTPNGLSFGQSTDFTNISGGINKFLVKNNDQSIEKSRLNFKLDTNKKYTFFIAGGVTKDSLTYVSLKDNLTVLTDTTAKIRLVNLVPSSPFLDLIFSKDSTENLASFSNINFKSGTDYKQFKPGIYFLKVRESGNKIDLLNVPNFKIEAKKIYTLWLKGYINGSGNQALDAQILKDN
ncbi:MAG: DUF4397 domain-containing protein [Bacteroidetes bacterium]|nr:DUF4397 domain-containing protein [Bacteroidota bacterium]MBU1372745.1 DUF4397 domain-containing protein [Bacteroidota bacterium]MBU1484941.1 DUF4397 domain-containing protein [Bacteroidota bacterium]MBU1762249.1 DUF4397 domain-containing protein [Bacteroidota bacterium]MBU2047010.1 DUF4397 domain-containing protein [Bacteroidota bacterium]